jgi:hypothetical protein
MTVEIADPVDGWPYDAIKANWLENQQKWQPVSEEFYHEQLGCLPPIQQSSGQFMVGECYSTDSIDDYYCGLVLVHGKYMAKFCHRKHFQRDAADLRQFINETPT